MAKRRLIWKLFLPYLAIISGIILITCISLILIYKNSYWQQASDDLAKRTELVKDYFTFEPLDTALFRQSILEIDKATGTRITLIGADGKVIADSRAYMEELDKHSDRPEIIDALAGKHGHSVRYSFTLKKDMMYYALPIFSKEGRIIMVLRNAVDVSSLYIEFSKSYTNITLIGVILFIFTAFLGFFLLQRHIKKINTISQRAFNYSKGNFEHKIYAADTVELHKLCESLNSMAEQLHEKLSIISQQKNIQQTVLESMKEGVLAVDYNERILFANNEAGEIFGFNSNDVNGKLLQEVVRISEVQKFFSNIISNGKQIQMDILVQHEKDKALQLRGTILHNPDGKAIGALVVVNDVSNLKYLDTLKKDLVANVSHELKTPVTTIKGFVETLKESDLSASKDTTKFLNIIYKNVERLNYLIDDLLSLSRIEQASESGIINFSEENIDAIVQSVLDDFEVLAADKNISLKKTCDKSITARVNRQLIEQAIGNLVDNAVKYSSKNKKVIINCFTESETLMMSVEDEGPGIEKEHFGRLFERFYRIDKSRSREVGGTGLGLAIVKHIVQAHGGSIEVESEPGRGSKFTLKIPLKRS